MMSAVMICTSSCAACNFASLLTFTSNARMTAYSGRFFSFMMAAFLMSFLWTSPMPTSKTGIFMSWRKDSSASRDPRVLAFTYTPSGCFSKSARMLSKPSLTSSFISSTSSSGPTTKSSVPAIASSRPGAQILTPIDVLIWVWCMYSFLTRISFMGCGVKSARMVVTIAPPIPAMTIWSPSRKVPFTRITSIVVPRPSMFLTSITVHWSSSCTSSLLLRRLWLRCRSWYRRSGTPSPVSALVGMMETQERGSSFSQ
mmetsp:Transcript_111852/g.316398  ORF Transcript_111852/g.316398 Transcript_111852/m.316398 type:complete len:256 (+) Transcript_111852:756-1523(+)